MKTHNDNKNIYIYPGSFCPPTFGHLETVKIAAGIFDEVIVLCSTNDDKKDKRWFSESECAELWKAYDLPPNVTVDTLINLKKRNIDPDRITMIRGIRDYGDVEHEMKVLELNKTEYGIHKYFFICADRKFKDISSTKARCLAEKLDIKNLSKYAAPLVVTGLLEKALNIDNLFLVVGPPASGKSTILKKMEEMNDRNIHINTDEFNEKLKPLLKKHFPSENLVEVAKTKTEKLKKIIGESWMRMLADSLLKAKGKKNVFVEIAFGLKEDLKLFEFIGGKIIYIGCSSAKINEERNMRRNTPELTGFIDKIPNRKKTEKIAAKYKLDVIYINADGIDDTVRIADELTERIMSVK